ncbi:unnamed protein product [Ambrosiozyma monospora]|uniref:Unnamed protein product n=1 Tax=Ambrosiozyma monospora TaxID=43982 RepID=A0ACB5SRY5_AMBMO|nr:unnamed protein product [Ambrosiozyma monospora]
MLERPDKYIWPSFLIESPNLNQIFTPQLRRVKGNAKFMVKKDIPEVVYIEFGFRGRSITNFLYQHAEHLHKDPVLYEERTTLFEKDSKRLYNSFAYTGSHSSTVISGTLFDVDFVYDFPTDVFLPSSCEELGDDEGWITVRYELFVKVRYLNDKGIEKSFELSCNVKYQGKSNSELVGIERVTTSHKLFKSKLKYYICDPETGRMVENSVLDAHRHTRKLRRVFDEKYKKENIENVSKNVELRIHIGPEKTIDVTSGLDALPIMIELPYVADVEPDFKIFGQSTELGLFEVKAFSFKILHDIHFQCNKFSYNTTIENEIFARKFLVGERPMFDTAFFQYYPERRSYCFYTTLGEMVGLTDPILSYLKDPIMNNVDVNHFRIKNTAVFEITVGNAQQEDQKSGVFQFKFGTVFKCEHSEKGVDSPYKYSGNVRYQMAGYEDDPNRKLLEVRFQ